MRNEVVRPPITGAAIRFITPDPVPLARRMRTSPMNIVATVMNFGRIRRAAPCTMASVSPPGSWRRPSRAADVQARSRYSSMKTSVCASTPTSAISPVQTAKLKIQAGRCFYCARDLARSGDVDHFVPWSRYPVDLGHDFVLAHTSCNGAKGSRLAAEEHLSRWAARNRSFGPAIGEACDRALMEPVQIGDLGLNALVFSLSAFS
jgi:5-methylcytosine-specific restriction endonuclease McrA